MIPCSFRIVILLSIFALLNLPGCSTVSNLASVINWPGSDDTIGADISNPDDTDTELAESIVLESEGDMTEGEICLTQELEALRLTGEWGAVSNEYTEQTIISDFTGPEISYDFPIVYNKQVTAYLDIFQGKQRKYFTRWLARSGKYLPMIQAELEAENLPLDLAYLAMIESGFNQRAYSRSRAVGLWQFMKATGREYNLRVDRYVDERRNAAKSTRAAVAYLKNLYEEFNDWHLAVAAYNGGPGTIRRALKRTKSEDFWQIAQKKSLRLETKRYVPKLIAAIIIAKDPEKYGFTNINYEKPLLYDTIKVGPGLSLDAAALLADTDHAVIKSLNMELRTNKTPLNKESYQLNIPFGSKTIAQNNLPRLHGVVSTNYKIHIVRKGESYKQIVRRYNVNLETIRRVNNLSGSTPEIGARLKIPYSQIHYRLLPEGTDVAMAARDELVLHTIKKGETISKISKKYQVPAEMIVVWNGLSSVHKITAGQQLALYLSNDSGRTSEKTASANSAIHLKSNHALKTQYRWYLVKSGDSLWTISRRFKTSPDDIRRWNNLKSNLIYPGNRLKVRDV
ncbi:MAG: LysM peptidoglycan-binding domain-containing protein [Desulfobulbaceae bacterium]|nr:MAG: LysM peptidoglycan-binding domain-containing protein [Desulfobulbaceae bacterium]